MLDHLANALRHRQGPSPRYCFVEPPFRGEEPYQLADEERIPFCLPVDRRRQLVAGSSSGGELDHLCDLGDVEPAEANRAGNRLASNLRHGLGQLLGSRLGVPVGADDDDARVAERSREELEEQQRGLVGGVEIVEHQGDRLRCGGLA